MEIHGSFEFEDHCRYNKSRLYESEIERSWLSYIHEPLPVNEGGGEGIMNMEKDTDLERLREQNKSK